MIKPVIIEVEETNEPCMLEMYKGKEYGYIQGWESSDGYVKTDITHYRIILIDTEAEIVEGDKYLYKETFLDGTVKTQEQFDNANWAIDACKKGDMPYIERARNGKNAQNGLLAVFKIISSTNKSHKLYEAETLASAPGFSLKTDDILLPQLSPQSIQLLINYYNEYKCMPESVEIIEIVDYQDKQMGVKTVLGIHHNKHGEIDITIPEVEALVYTEAWIRQMIVNCDSEGGIRWDEVDEYFNTKKK